MSLVYFQSTSHLQVCLQLQITLKSKKWPESQMAEALTFPNQSLLALQSTGLCRGERNNKLLQQNHQE